MNLGRVVWIGGGSFAGKTSVAERLSARYGLQLYRPDLLEHEHAARVEPTRQPMMAGFLAMTMDERWVETTPSRLAETILAYSRERFPMLLGDIAGLAGRVLAEGFQILPRSVAPLLEDTRHAIFLVPSERFRQRAVRERGRGTAGRDTSDPERAHRNRIERDRLIGEHVRVEAAEHGLAVLDVDGQPLDELTREVERHFGPLLDR